MEQNFYPSVFASKIMDVSCSWNVESLPCSHFLFKLIVTSNR